ncbi:MAG: hypothetical protein DRH90_12615, partial [Deltaproteobacteria bacterium]
LISDLWQSVLASPIIPFFHHSNVPLRFYLRQHPCGVKSMSGPLGQDSLLRSLGWLSLWCYSTLAVNDYSFWLNCLVPEQIKFVKLPG